MNNSDKVMERAERILDGIILQAESFCPHCRSLMEKIFQK